MTPQAHTPKDVVALTSSLGDAEEVGAGPSCSRLQDHVKGFDFPLRASEGLGWECEEDGKLDMFVLGKKRQENRINTGLGPDSSKHPALSIIHPVLQTELTMS